MYVYVCVYTCIVLYCFVLYWIGLDCIGLDWIGLDWFRLYCVEISVLHALYGDVSITEKPDDPDSGELHFDIELIENPMDLDIEHEGFKKYAGDVLVSILSNAFETGEYEIGERESGDEGSTEPTD